jgi:hypothetical protein
VPLVRPVWWDLTDMGEGDKGGDRGATVAVAALLPARDLAVGEPLTPGDYKSRHINQCDAAKRKLNSTDHGTFSPLVIKHTR